MANFSVVDFLSSRGMDSSKEARAALASRLGIKDYDFSADKNLELLSRLHSLNQTQVTNQYVPHSPINQISQTQQDYNPNEKSWKMDNGFYVDKRTGQAHIIENHRNVEDFPVITGANVEGNKALTPYGGGEEYPFRDKVTPVGTYHIGPSGAPIYGYPGYDVYNQNGEEQQWAIHRTYDPATRNKFYSSPNPADRNASFGCVNCQQQDIDKLRRHFPNGTTLQVTDSNPQRPPIPVPYNPMATINTGFLQNTAGIKYAQGGQLPNLQVGQTVELTEEQIEHLKSLGYRFK